MNQQLVNYIQQQLKSGYDVNSIKNFLLQQGYNAKDVNEAVEFVNMHRLSSLIDYAKASLSKGTDPDTIKSQLLASGYQMPDINEALAKAGQKPSKLPTSTILIVLVALVIFGLGLFFFWPSGPEETTSPGIIDYGAEDFEEDTGPAIAFETEPTVSFEKEPEMEYGFEEDLYEEDEDLFEEFEEEEEFEEMDFSAETSDFEDLIERASQETNIDSALSICKEAENTMYMDACYAQLSKTFDSSAICAKITDESLRDECYLRIVLKNKDSSLCENIIDSSLYNSCTSISSTTPTENVTMGDFADWGV